jgi:retinoblastoma-like protein 1
VLKGDSDSLTGLLEPVNFEFNAKSIRKEYESYVLSIGEYDERVFLGESANEEIGTPAANDNTTPKKDPLGEDIESRSQGSRLIPMTPISAKHLTRDKEQLNLTPVSSSTYLVSRLIKLLGRRENGPSTKLKELFATCDTDPTEMIANRVKELGDIFYTKYTSPNLEHPGSHEPIARMRLRMGAILYYKNLETILFKERANNKPLGNLLGQEQFHSVLFACCLEIVIFSYNSPSRTFPWVLNTFDLKEFHFYKVIEVIIRAEEWLPREVVKHLQSIEEQILESRAWVSDSPLWEAIAHDPLKVPSWEDVSLSSSSGHVTTLADVTQSPLSHHGRGFVVKCNLFIFNFHPFKYS